MRKEGFHRLKQSIYWDPVPFDCIQIAPDLLSAARYVLLSTLSTLVLFRGSLRFLSNRPNHETAFAARSPVLLVTSCALLLKLIHQQMNILARVNTSISKIVEIITENKHYFHSWIILHHVPMHLTFILFFYYLNLISHIMCDF